MHTGCVPGRFKEPITARASKVGKPSADRISGGMHAAVEPVPETEEDSTVQSGKLARKPALGIRPICCNIANDNLFLTKPRIKPSQDTGFFGLEYKLMF